MSVVITFEESLFLELFYSNCQQLGGYTSGRDAELLAGES